MKKLIALILAAAFILTLTACGDTEKSADFSSVKTGDIIKFGKFEGNAISWRVLAVKDGEALILSDKVLENQKYHNEYVSITWENCDLRAYLNGEFYENAFSEEEKALIVDTNIINDDNPEYGTAGGNDTSDKVFLLSIGEAKSYFADDEARIAYSAEGKPHWWWLRSSGYGEVDASYVLIDGRVFIEGNDVNSENGQGVRPALRVKLEKV